MRGWTCFVLLTLAACGTGDDVADGTRTLCAEGGALNDCPDAAQSVEAACWRLVDCAVIPVHRNDGGDDWDRCIARISDEAEFQRRLIVACIASATCDQLKIDNADRCFAYGDN
jgi:hypothetical protein